MNEVNARGEMDRYVHGYSEAEALRLKDQADILARLLYGDIHYPAAARVLEAGCGTGCQTVHLAAANPGARFTCLDISAASLELAAQAAAARGLANAEFLHGDILRPPLPLASFDHLFICFVLEHLPDPAAALASLRALLKPGGGITVIEGDHGSFYCHPESAPARRTVQCLVALQALAGGDANIGRRLYPLLRQAGFASPLVEPRMVYVDASRPELIEGFSRNTFIAMVRGVRQRALEQGLVRAEDWDAGIDDLERAATPDGTFCYTFFRATAVG